MADPYSQCPTCGKKLKFCSPATPAEQEKLERLKADGQLPALKLALEKLLAKHPTNLCLQVSMADVLLQTGQVQDAAKAVDKLMMEHPKAAPSWTMRGLMLALTKDPMRGIEALQIALELNPEPIPAIFVQALLVLGRRAVATGFALAGIAHLELAATLDPDSEATLDVISQVYRARELHPILKLEMNWDPIENEAEFPWATSYNMAMRLAEHGRWRQAAGLLTNLAETPKVWFMQGLLNACLAQNAEAAVALRKVSDDTSVPYVERVEAEALAQLLDTQNTTDFVSHVTQTYVVKDVEAVRTGLLSEKRTMPMPVQAEIWTSQDETPPEFNWLLIDRPLPEDWEKVTPAETPRQQGMLMLFGKRTDRDAQLVIDGFKDSNWEATQAWLKQATGGGLGEMEGEQVLDLQPTEVYLLSPAVPAAVRRSKAMQLTQELSKHLLFTAWTKLPQKRLGGKSASEAIGDAALQLKLEAGVMLLEYSFPFEDSTTWAELRKQLQLPDQTLLPVTEAQDLRDWPLVRLGRADLKNVDDETLCDAFERATNCDCFQASRPLGLELVSRPSLSKHQQFVNAYIHLTTHSAPTQGLEWIKQAREKTAGLLPSDSIWDMLEFEIYSAEDQSEPAAKLLQRLSKVHSKEPQVQQFLFKKLYEMGVIDQNGRPVQRPGMPPVGAPGAAPAAAAEPSRLWTPDQPAAAAPPQGKSGLWIPE